MSGKSFKIFMDFDGTVAKTDVGEAIFTKYGDMKKVSKIIDDLLSDAITSREAWIQLCNSVEEVNKDELDNFIDQIPVEETFYNFSNYCANKNIELIIVSDGFDYYINRILKKNNLAGIKVFANNLIIDNNGKLIPSFPYYHENCRSSANCKQIHIINNSSDEDFTVFIGDGNSDKDSVHFVDFIFAKDGLLKYCEKERISFFPFKNFDDVILRLKELFGKKRLKKRHRAVLKRNETYMIE